MDRKAWHAAIYGVTKSQTRLSNWTELNLIFNSKVKGKEIVTEKKAREGKKSGKVDEFMHHTDQIIPGLFCCCINGGEGRDVLA